MKEAVLSVLRHALTFGGGFVVTAGYAAESDVNTAIGAVIAIVGVAWGVWDKYRAKKDAEPAK